MHTPAHSDDQRIFHLSMEFMQPKAAERLMKRNLDSKLKLQEKILLKDQLMCLKTVGTNEVQSLVIKICKKIRVDKDKSAEKLIKYIMNLKIDDVKKEIEEGQPQMARW